MERLVAVMATHQGKEDNPHFSLLAVIFFMASFAVARTFTTLFPSTVVLVGGGIHLHHFWYGLALLAVGGWMGIVNKNERIDQLAAVLYGAGGGLIADEFGLLLTFGNYWSSLTYTAVAMLLAFALLGALLINHAGTIREQFSKLTRNDIGLYLGILLGMVSVAFLLETTNVVVFVVAAILGIIALIVFIVFFAFWLTAKRKAETSKQAQRK
jgi:hypothetical protein